jgi:hypothetical protein
MCAEYGVPHTCKQSEQPSVEPLRFDSEFMAAPMRCTLPLPKEAALQCTGIVGKEYSALYGVKPDGNPRAEDIRYLLSTNAFVESGYPKLHTTFSQFTTDQDIVDQVDGIGMKWYVGCFNKVRSVFCTGYAVSGHLCTSCSRVQSDPRFVNRAKRKLQSLMKIASGDPDNMQSIGANTDSMVHTELLTKVTQLATSSRESYHKGRRNAQKISQLSEKINALKSDMQRLARREQDLPEFLQILNRSYNEGLLADHGAFIEVLKSVADALKNGRKHRKLSPVMKSFYGRLLVHGGPLLHNFVSQIFLGPHTRRTRAFTKGTLSDYMLGLKIEFLQVVRKILTNWGIQDAPVVLGEDATALQSRLDAIVEGGSCFVMGFTGGKLEIKSIDDLRLINENEKLATSMYLFVVIPLVPGAPYIPLFVQLQDGTKDTFNAASITHTWHHVMHLARDTGLHVVGHVGDGAAPFRKATYGAMFRECPDDCVDAHISFNHPLVQLSMPMTFKGDWKSFIMCTVDYLHICWRVRVQLLSPSKCLMVFGLPASHSKILLHTRNKGHNSLGTKYSDLDWHDKQNWQGTLRIFGFETNPKTREVKVNTKVMDAFKDGGDYYGLYLVLLLAHKYTGIFVLKNRPVQDVINDCGWCLSFLAYWHKSMSDMKVKSTMKENFLTAETFQDMVISLNAVVLMAKYFAVHHPNMVFDPSRLSSRFVEYMFQYLRIQGAGHNVKLSAMSAMNKLRAYDAMLELDGQNEVLPDMQSKRGMPRGKERIPACWDKAPDGYYPSEEDLVASFAKGVSDLQALLRATVDNGCMTFIPWDNLHDPHDLEALANEHLLEPMKRAAADEWGDRFPSYRPQCSSGPQLQTGVQGMPDDGDEGLPSPPDVDDSIGGLAMPALPDEADDSPHDGERDDDDDVDGMVAGSGMGGEVDGMGAYMDGVDANITKQEELLERARATIDKIFSSPAAINDDSYCEVSGGDAPGDDFKELVRRVRDKCNSVNAMIGRQGTDRVAGRFGQLRLRDISEVAYKSNKYYADDDFVAVLFKGENYQQVGRKRINMGTWYEVYYGVIEKITYRVAPNRLENISLVHCDDTKGEFRIRFLDRVLDSRSQQKRGAAGHAHAGKAMFQLPLAASDGVSDRVTATEIICVVDMVLSDDRYYYLNKGCEEQADKVKQSHLSGSAASSSTGGNKKKNADRGQKRGRAK